MTDKSLWQSWQELTLREKFFYLVAILSGLVGFVGLGDMEGWSIGNTLSSKKLYYSLLHIGSAWAIILASTNERANSEAREKWKHDRKNGAVPEPPKKTSHEAS